MACSPIFVCGLGGVTDESASWFAMTGGFSSAAGGKASMLEAMSPLAARRPHKIAAPAGLEAIVDSMVEAVESYADTLAKDLDKVEERC